MSYITNSVKVKQGNFSMYLQRISRQMFPSSTLLASSSRLRHLRLWPPCLLLHIIWKTLHEVRYDVDINVIWPVCGNEPSCGISLVVEIGPVVGPEPIVSPTYVSFAPYCRGHLEKFQGLIA